ncbi:MAG: crossover junction endodeoxyribonuclease RuvC [Proteobacteria bacterium]|nr:crossover junction endodeoxyribonuclease RuvC [Pseudomonadota bacterium]
MQRISPASCRILGIDPGLNHTGWGVIEAEGNRLSYLACGRINAPASLEMAARLSFLHAELCMLIAQHKPDEAAVEETFVNKNAASALKLGMARGIAMLAPAENGLSVAEYSANLIKKSVSGYGHAEKEQLARMVKVFLPKADFTSNDAADALAVAICHAHHRQSLFRHAREGGHPRKAKQRVLWPVVDPRLRGDDKKRRAAS